ncbi:uncharacterized protein LOC135846512 isoform X2 [Planococcus citri]
MSQCEYICDSCSQPLTTAVNTGDQIHVTTCYHVYHYSCLWLMYTCATEINEWNEKITSCGHPGCNRMISVSDISPAIDFSTRIVPHPHDDDVQNDSRNQDQDINYRILMLRDFNVCLQLSIVSLTNENSTLRAQAESSKRAYANLMTRYNMLLDQVKNLISIGQQSSLPEPTPKPKNNNMLHSNESNAPQPPPISSLMNSGSFPAPKTPQNSNSTQNSFGQRQLLSLPAPPTLHNDRPDVEATASKQSSKIPDPPAPAIPNRTQSLHKPPIPAPEQKKGTSADKDDYYHRRYRLRFGTECSELIPYHPLDSYPHDFTAARLELAKDTYVSAFFAYNILLMGDGAVESIAKDLEIGQPYKGQLDTQMYRRDLLLADLLRHLRSFDKLPKRIMLSIGNFDVKRGTAYSEFFQDMQNLCLLFKRHEVRELIILPLIPHPMNNKESFSRISEALAYNWEPSLGGKITRIPEAFRKLHSSSGYMDKSGPFYQLESYYEVVRKIKEKFIPEILKKPNDSNSLEENSPASPKVETTKKTIAKNSLTPQKKNI